MKKLIYIIILAFAIVTAGKIFAQQKQKTKMVIGTQQVASAFGRVCLIHKDSIERRNLRVGESIDLANQIPANLSTGDHAAIHSQRFNPNYWDASKMEIWRNNALKSLNRGEIKPLSNLSKTNEVSGRVLTNDSLDPVVKAIISFFDEKGKLEAISNSDKEGKYFSKLPAGKHHYEVRSSNCLSYFDSLIVLGENVEIENLILIPRVKVGNRIILENVTFETNKSILKPISWPELDALTNFLKENKGMEIELSGHTDNVGSDSYNQRLSESRAKAVVNYLVEHGIDVERLKFTGYGEAQPIASNETEEGKGKNRRTEFQVTKFVANR